ncbi:amidohydrolase family protein [Paraburkholderia sp. Ac-20336]|uniref:amidohydrolase family protein n=1 Tax=unclassified Paraburkholderia TaxID=2615204 RepID=UPI00197E2FD6|nr:MULTISPECIES: amidohydrolase family protein [unclassified Paraburkholderia]MBN3802843.1 amidohydrolase family protein [Paraburkholderia sp. Ac-20336]MBN3847551.1 amidohydrolase family protein [Paraburkholderia sp. Ac-20342]
MTLACLPALPSVRPPRNPAPRFSCDCHFHVFGDPLAYPLRYPFTTPRDYTPPAASLHAWRDMAAVLGLERMVIVQPSVYGTDNRCTLDALQAVGVERGRAVVVLGDDVSDEALERLHRAGVRGVRFNLVNAGGLTPDRINTIAHRVAAFGWHLQFYVDGPQLPALAPLIAGLPTPAVIDHMGQIRASSPTYRQETEALLRLLSNGKTWVKLCGYRASTTTYPYDDVLALARALVAAAPERCVWGTDWPHPGLVDGMPEDAALLDLLDTWTPTRAVRDRILVDNPAVLYGFAD